MRVPKLTPAEIRDYFTDSGLCTFGSEPPDAELRGEGEEVKLPRDTNVERLRIPPILHVLFNTLGAQQRLQPLPKGIKQFFLYGSVQAQPRFRVLPIGQNVQAECANRDVRVRSMCSRATGRANLIQQEP